MPEVIFTERALTDIRQIRDYLIDKTSDVSSADAFTDAIIDRAILLSSMPEVGVPCSRKGIEEQCRIFFFQSYLIVYQRHNERLRILRVFHQSVNYPDKV